LRVVVAETEQGELLDPPNCATKNDTQR
jgi:hypothetical protein